jgi:hypothetical protein
MISHPSRLYTPLLATGLAVALAACGGSSQSAGQSTGPAAQVVTTPPAGSGSDAAGGGAAAAPKVTKPGPNVTPEGVVFNYKAEGKPKIYLAGNFNKWNPSDPQFLMKDDDGDGIYSITVKLAPGTYQYKYVIDSKWTQDPYGPGSAPDGFGGQNSQFDVK